MRRLLLLSIFAVSPAWANPLYLDCTWEGPVGERRTDFTLNPGSNTATVNEVSDGVLHTSARASFTTGTIVVDYKERSGPSYFWLRYEIDRTNGSMTRQNKFLGDVSTESWQQKQWSTPLAGACKKRTLETLF